MNVLMNLSRFYLKGFDCAVVVSSNCLLLMLKTEMGLKLVCRILKVNSNRI